jgi:Predicted membrane protein (DUF2339)
MELIVTGISIVALIMAMGARKRLRRLEDRIAGLATGGQAAQPITPTIVAPSAEARLAAVEQPVRQDAAAEPAPTTEQPVPVAPAAEESASTALEKKFGTQWVVWIGGLALALGGIFLVRYTIEQGLLGPGVRVFLGAIFSALLIAAGEWARRNEIAAGITAIPTRHIPSILTAAGTVAAYATVYAAFELYGFLSPAVAFILLGLVALATLAAALLHGPALAGLGVAGAFVTPLLIASQTPNYWALYVYLAIVTAAALGLARLRLWRWLAITAVILGTLWTLPGVEYPRVDELGAHLFHVISGFVRVAALIVSGLFYGPSGEPGKPDQISSGALAAYLLAATVLVIASVHALAALAVFTILTTATVAIAWRTEAALWAVPAAGLMTILAILHWAVPEMLDQLVLAPGVTRGAIPGPSTGTEIHLALGLAFAALFGVSGYAAQSRTGTALTALLWSATAVVTPIANPYRALFAHCGIRSLDSVRRPRAPARRTPWLRDRTIGEASPPRPCHGVSHFCHRRCRRTLALDKGWLTVGFALMVPGIAWISECRPLPALRIWRRRWSRWCCCASPTSRASSATMSAPHHSSIGYFTATGCRPRRSGTRVTCCGGAPMMLPRAWPIRRRSCSRCCSPYCKFAIT